MRPDRQLPSEVQLFLPQGIYGPRVADRVAVTLGGKALPVGELRLYASGEEALSEFRYDAPWLKHSRFFPVSPELRETRSSQWRRPPRTGGRNVFAALADTEPTGFALSVIQRARERGLLDAFRRPGTERGAMDGLCTVLDTCRLGALRVHPSKELSTDTAAEKRLLPRRSDLDGIGAAVAAFERGQEDLRQLLLLLYCATALGGSRPKCSWIQEDGQLAIAKFPSVVDAFPVNRAEVLAMHLAKAVGIEVVDVKLMHSINAPILLAPRFDRPSSGGRSPFLSARSLLLAENSDAVDHFDLLDAMRIHCKDFAADARQLWRRLVLRLLINDAGANLSKIGFLYAGNGRWCLAPAHGLRPCFFPSTSQSKNRGEKEDRRADLETLVEASRAFGIEPSLALDFLRHQLKVIKGWKNLASQFEVSMSAEEIEMVEVALNNEQAALARQLVSS